MSEGWMEDDSRVVLIIDKMINIPMGEFMGWFERRMDRKYAMKIEELKRSLIFFYNLADQVSSLYNAIRINMEKYNDKEEYKDIVTLLTRSLALIVRVTEPLPICLDSFFCERFISTFDIHVNLLCIYFHSLSHYELIKQAKFQKDKIVEGINKMHSVHGKIKDLFKHNIEVIQTLTHIAECKDPIIAKIGSIQKKLKLHQEKDLQFADNFEKEALEFYKEMLDKIKMVNEEPEAKKSLMRVYFQLMHQLYSTQAHLQLLLDNSIRTCGQIRSRKKNISFLGQQNCSHLTRWANVLLKPSVSLKSIRKLKIQDFLKAVAVVLQEKDTHNAKYLEHFENHQEEIQALASLIMEIARELEKIEQSGLLTLIAEYREGLMPQGSKKFIQKLLEYQSEMSLFYQLHEETKLLQQLVQSTVLVELGEKVNVIIEMEEGGAAEDGFKLRPQDDGH